MELNYGMMISFMTVEDGTDAVSSRVDVEHKVECHVETLSGYMDVYFELIAQFFHTQCL